MAKDSKIRMPSSEGGIVRYFDNESPSKINIPPLYIVIFTAAICVIGLIIAFIS